MSGVKKSIYLEKDLHEKTVKAVNKEDRSFSQIVSRALRKYLSKPSK